MPCRIYTWPVYLKCLHVKSESVWYLSFQEEYLSMGWCGNLDSSMVKSARLVNWRSVVQISAQVQMANLFENLKEKSKILNIFNFVYRALKKLK